MTEEQVFLAALELADPAERAAYLDRACGRDVELRRQVEKLLAAHFRTGAFLDASVGQQLAAGSATRGNKTPASLPADPEDSSTTDANNADEKTDDLHFLQP